MFSDPEPHQKRRRGLCGAALFFCTIKGAGAAYRGARAFSQLSLMPRTARQNHNAARKGLLPYTRGF